MSEELVNLKLKDTFCSSPWFHIRINPSGYYLPCRWDLSQFESDHNIADTSISEYMNSEVMRKTRMALLEGKIPDICVSCVYQDKMGKISGRKKQLLKSGIHTGMFEKTLCASPHWSWFQQSADNDGYTDCLPVDLQIDLGNTCNSACIMCIPTYSSKMATDYKKLNPANPDIFPKFPQVKNWADDSQLVDKFVRELEQIPNIRYIHFLGGETLFLKSFYDICNRLIESGLSKDIIIGTTTNGTIYTEELDHIIKNFKHVHFGVSIETATNLNDYIRWPSKIETVLDNLNKFLKLKSDDNFYLSLRITPNIFSIYHIDSLLEFMIENSVTAESCDLLRKPSWLRIENLPSNIKQEIINKLDNIIEKYQIDLSAEKVVNQRNDKIVPTVIASTIKEYREFVSQCNEPDNVEEERGRLVRFIKSFESLRNNKILDYLPEYEDFLRNSGY